MSFVTIDFRILGPLEVEGDDGPIALGGGKQRALLGLLLVHANEVLSSDRLLDELWGEHPPRTAATSLHNLLSQLRKLLGANVVVTRSPGYVLQVPPERIDAARFERLVGAARKSPGERPALLREALALWRGSPLADLAFEPFAQGEIRRLEELRLEALEERIEADIETGLGQELVAELESLVQRHPLRERLRRQLMLTLYRSGRQAEALDLYHETRARLADELGIDPGPGLQQLYASILRQETNLAPAASPARPADHYANVVEALTAGRLVTVLGAGVNRQNGHAAGDLPTLREMAAHLAERFDCPPGHAQELARVSQFVALTKGVGPLYDELHALLDRDLDPGPVHHLVAETAAVLREGGLPRQLVVTPNFDHALERAFAEAKEPVDVVSYIALGRHRGKFLHLTDEGEARVVDVPNAYPGLSGEDRTVVLKVHGQVDRQPAREWESFVVSEDDHIEYLAQAEISSLVPVTLVARLRRSHFLFLGYPLHDWGLRVFLQRIWGHEKVAYRSWAVEPEPEPLARELWGQRGVDVFDVPLDEYLADLRKRLIESTRTVTA
jgi:DNA-binding SARP family transcriptional activator